MSKTLFSVQLDTALAGERFVYGRLDFLTIMQRTGRRYENFKFI